MQNGSGLYKTPFTKNLSEESSVNKVSSRWEKLDIDNKTDVTNNSFMRTNNDSDLFSNTNDNKSNFKEHGYSSSFIRYTKPVAPPPPKEFNMKDMESEFPALGN